MKWPFNVNFYHVISSQINHIPFKRISTIVWLTQTKYRQNKMVFFEEIFLPRIEIMFLYASKIMEEFLPFYSLLEFRLKKSFMNFLFIFFVPKWNRQFFMISILFINLTKLFVSLLFLEEFFFSLEIIFRNPQMKSKMDFKPKCANFYFCLNL